RSDAQVDRLQALRVEVDARGVLAQRGGGFVDLDRGAVEQRDRLFERGVDRGQRAQPLNRAMQLAEQRVVAVDERLGGAARAFDERSGVRQALVLGLQRLPFVRTRLQRLEL